MFKTLGDLLISILNSILGEVITPILKEIRKENAAILEGQRAQMAYLIKISRDLDAVRSWLNVPLEDADQKALDDVLASMQSFTQRAEAINLQPPTEE